MKMFFWPVPMTHSTHEDSYKKLRGNLRKNCYKCGIDWESYNKTMTNNNKKIYGHYLVEELPDQNGKWGGFRCSVIDAKGKYGFIAKTNIPIKEDATAFNWRFCTTDGSTKE
jgi:hypothetical protein